MVDLNGCSSTLLKMQLTTVLNDLCHQLVQWVAVNKGTTSPGLLHGPVEKASWKKNPCQFFKWGS